MRTEKKAAEKLKIENFFSSKCSFPGRAGALNWILSFKLLNFLCLAVSNFFADSLMNASRLRSSKSFDVGF